MFDLPAEQDEDRGEDQGHGSEQHQGNGHSAAMQKAAIARDLVGRLEALNEALDDAGCGPKGDQAGEDEQVERPRAGDAELVHDEIFGAGGNNLREGIFQGVGDELGAGLHQNGGGGGEHGKEREQRGVGGALGDGEAVVIGGRKYATAEQPTEGAGIPE